MLNNLELTGWARTHIVQIEQPRAALHRDAGGLSWPCERPLLDAAEHHHTFLRREVNLVSVTDIDDVWSNDELMYVGLTRARLHLAVVAGADVLQTLRFLSRPRNAG